MNPRHIPIWKTVTSHTFESPEEYRKAFKGGGERPSVRIHTAANPLIDRVRYGGHARQINIARVRLSDIGFEESVDHYGQIRKRVASISGIQICRQILALDLCHLCAREEPDNGDRVIIATRSLPSEHGPAVFAIEREGKSVWLHSYPVTSRGVFTPRSQIAVELVLPPAPA